MVHEVDAMILVEVNTPAWHQTNFDKNLNKEGLDNLTDLVEEIKIMAHVREFTAKQRMSRRFITRATWF